MTNSGPADEPMCETSEERERLYTRSEILPISLEVGRRILEVFGNQSVSHVVLRLRASSREVNAVINGESLPSAELLLGIQKITGASIDWILTGRGQQFLAVETEGDQERFGVTTPEYTPRLRYSRRF